MGSILGSLLGHFGVHFGSLWGHFGVPGGTPPQRRGSILGPHFEAFWGPLWEPLGDPLGTHGDPKGTTGRPKALPKGVSRGLQKQTPKRTSFWTPPGGAQVSSRHGESRIFKNSGGSLWGPILAPFWASGGTWRAPGDPLCRTCPPGPSEV